MPVVAKVRAKPLTEPRAILGPTGNRVRVSEEAKRKIEGLKKAEKQLKQKPKRPLMPPPPTAAETTEDAVKSNLSVDSYCSSDSSSGSSSRSDRRSVKAVSGGRKSVKCNGVRSVKVTSSGGESTEKVGPAKRCDWITANSDPVYTSFHDEEWGVPVHGDRKLFELLVFSQALAELSWPSILHMRDTFRKLFDNFDASSIAQYTDKKLLSLKVNGNLLLSEPKLRAIVENAKQILKVQQEFGSLNSYFWRFMNHKPIRNGFRYSRQVPVKTPKAETISKDLMQRGFRCVGPTVVYSFMQAAGMVNDHLVSCFRHQECEKSVDNDLRQRTEETGTLTAALQNARLSQ